MFSLHTSRDRIAVLGISKPQKANIAGGRRESLKRNNVATSFPFPRRNHEFHSLMDYFFFIFLSMTHQFREGIGRNKNKMGNIDGVKKSGKDGRASFQIVYFLVHIFFALLIFDSLRENGERKK